MEKPILSFIYGMFWMLFGAASIAVNAFNLIKTNGNAWYSWVLLSAAIIIGIDGMLRAERGIKGKI